MSDGGKEEDTTEVERPWGEGEDLRKMERGLMTGNSREESIYPHPYTRGNKEEGDMYAKSWNKTN